MNIKTVNKKYHLLNIFWNNKFIILALMVMVFFHIRYLVISTRNVPFMDYWRFIAVFGDKIIDKTFAFSDIWNTGAEWGNRNPLVNILLALNMGVFGYNTQIEIFASVLFNVSIAILLIYAFNKENTNIKNNKIKWQLLCLPFILTSFSLNQWEILTLQFSLAFMIRIFCYTGIFIWINACFFNMKKYYRHLYAVSAIIFMAIIFISQAYFAAFAGAIGTVIIVNFCINYKKEKLIYLKNYLYMLFFIIIGSFVYLYNLNIISGNITVKSGVFIFNFIKGILLMFGSSLCQYFTEYSWLGINSRTLTYITGIITCILYIFALFLYIKRKLYKKTYIPLFFIIYCFLNIGIIYVTRAYSFDLYYLTASRYTCETTFGLTGMLWIFGSLFAEKKKKLLNPVIIEKIAICISICIIVSGLLASSYFERKIGYYRGKNFEKLSKNIGKIDTLSDAELEISTQAPACNVRAGVLILKQHNLGIFKNDIDTSKNNVKYEYTGFYDNKNEEVWINGKAEIIAHNNNSVNRFVLTGYYPETFPGNYITVTINNNESITKEMIPGKVFDIEIDFENKYQKVKIGIKTDKTFIPKNEGWNEDLRELGVYIVKWSLLDNQ